MKKTVFIILCAVAAMASVSCAKLDVNDVAVGQRVPAVINATAGVSTRATIDGLQTAWEAGDKISVFDATGKAEGAFTANASGTSVAFTGTKDEGDALKYAIYPANESATCAAGVFTTTIPSEQDGTINSSLAIAEEKDGKFEFRNAASVIKITIPAEETAINFVAFVADNGAAIAGDVTADMTDLKAVVSTADGAVKYSRVSVYRDGQPLSGDLYLTVIPGNYSGTLVFGKKDGTVRYAATVKLASKDYNVDRIKNFGTAANMKWIQGAVPGVFSIDSNGRKALMSQGYIQYNAADQSWKIADTFVRLTGWDPEGVIELFRWDNADTPTSTTTHASGYSEDGDWAKKLAAGWSTGTWEEYEFCFKNTQESSHDSREAHSLVQHCLGLVQVTADEYYAILYPDGWAGQFALYTASDQVPSVTMTIDELKVLEDKGCAILGLGGILNNGAWAAMTPPQMNIWTTVWKDRKNAYAFRLVFTGGNWQRLVRTVYLTYGYLARPYYEILE